jgi:hypothetical protein
MDVDSFDHGTIVNGLSVSAVVEMRGESPISKEHSLVGGTW